MFSTHSVFSAYDCHIVAIFVLVLFCHVVHYQVYVKIIESNLASFIWLKDLLNSMTSRSSIYYIGRSTSGRLPHRSSSFRLGEHGILRRSPLGRPGCHLYQAGTTLCRPSSPVPYWWNAQSPSSPVPYWWNAQPQGSRVPYWWCVQTPGSAVLN